MSVETVKESSNRDADEDGLDDVISNLIGEYGRWQFKLTFLLSLFNIPCTFHIFGPTFQAAEKDVWCIRPHSLTSLSSALWSNLTQSREMCSFLDTNRGRKPMLMCDEWEVEGNENTIVTEFGLFCDREYLVSVAEMMFLAGVAIGGLVGGIVSDKFGRKRTLISCVFFQALIGTIIAFAPWFEMYTALRAILGFVSVTVVFSGFVLSVELVGGKWRTVAGVSYIFPVAFSYMIVAGIAWFIKDWRKLQLALSLPGFIFVTLWWILPESPLWLLAMGRTDDLKKVLCSAAKTNNIQLPENVDKYLVSSSDNRVESAGVLDLFKTAKMRKTTFLLSVIWFVIYLVYYGLVLNMGNIGGDLYINSVISGAVEIPAVAISILFLLRMGRRWPLSMTVLLAGVACLCSIPVLYTLQNYQWVITSLAMLGKFSISSSNSIIPIFTAELYPTTIRNIGVGASNVTAGIALLLVPYLWDLTQIQEGVPMAVLGISGIIGGIAILLLPETSNKPLAVTLNDTDKVVKVAVNLKNTNKNSNENV